MRDIKSLKKPNRKAVLIFVLKDGFISSKVLAIKYTTGEDKDFYDIPGRLIDDQIANSVKTAEWDIYEETGIMIEDPIYKGNVIIDQPKENLDIDVYVSTKYEGKIKKYDDHIAQWISCEKLLFSEKTYPTIEILRHLANDQLRLYIKIDENNKFLEIKEK